MTEECKSCSTGIEVQTKQCPDCGSQMDMAEGCSVCMACGFSPCK